MRVLLFKLCMPGLLFAFSACNGLFEGIYDAPPSVSHQELTQEVATFQRYDSITRQGRIVIDVRDYRKWTYIDFEKQTLHTMPIPNALTQPWDGKSGIKHYQVTFPSTFVLDKTQPTDSMPTPDQWDIALHHYDVRTHGGAALETHHTSLQQLLQEGQREQLLQQDFSPDVWTEHHCYYDLTSIFDFYIGYHQSWCNTTLSRWMDMNVTQPPPTYTLSHRVYLLKLPNQRFVALHFPTHVNQHGQKGWVTIDFIYPY